VIGTVHIIYGGPVRQGTVSLQTSDALITGEAAGDLFGTSTAVGNILSLEGTDPKNLAVGAPAAAGGRGAVYLFAGPFGSFDSLTAGSAVFKILGRPGDQIGTMLATADLNNDGYREIVVGAPGTHRVYVIKGGPTLSGTLDLADLATPAPAMTIDIPGIGGVLTAGDVNADGIQDLFIGAPTQNAVYAFAGQTGSFPTALASTFTGIDAGDMAGAALRLADLDADGRRDLIIGAPGAAGPANGRPGAGEAYVIWGGSGALTSRSLALADVTFYGNSGERFGAGLAAGDVNRDIPNDAVFLADAAAGGSGILYIYYGRPRTAMGTALPDGRREVDFAVSGQVDRRIGSGTNIGAIRSVQVFEVTGEGARDIIVGIPSTSTNTGSVYFTLSPKMTPSLTSVTIATQRDTTKQTSIQITNVAPIPITWAATGDRPWLAALTSGTAVDGAPGTLTITASAAGLAPGTYTGTVAVTSTSPDLTMQVSIAVSLVVTQTMLGLDSPIHLSTVSQPFNIGGWALDAGSTSGPGIDTIHIWAFPVAGGEPVFLAEAHTGGARPDVGAAFGNPEFNTSGFNLQVTGLTPGRYIIALYVHNARTGTFDASTGVWVTVLSSSSMVIDTHRDGAVLNPNFYVAGWAIDAAAKTGTGVDAIHVWAIPQNGSPNKFLGVATYGDSRPDLGNAFGARFTNSGWHLDVTGLAPGLYTIAVYAHSTVSGSFTDSRGFTATVMPSGRMSLDSPAANSTVPHEFLVAGWAIDLAATSGTGVDTVHVWATPTLTSGGSARFVGVASYGSSRPDVGAAVGNHQFDNCGFNLLVNTLPAGTYTISVYGRTISSGFSLIQTKIVTVQ
jgi:hypothetical protein